jgi:ornithine decarboxylase
VRDLSLKLRGVSFHVGSGGCAFKSYKDSIENAEKIFAMALRFGMEPLDIMDIGGGFTMDCIKSENNFDIVAP